MTPTDYESKTILHQYLLFHYGSERDQFGSWPPPAPSDYPGRCAQAALQRFGPGRPQRALDVGCAVGGSTFALAREIPTVLGLDLSETFIRAANQLKTEGRATVERVEEGDLTTTVEVQVDPAIDRSRITFQVGDACALSSLGLKPFDLVLAANLIDRLPKPRAFLTALPPLIADGGLLALMSPYTWLESFTPKAEWLGGRETFGRRIETLAGLKFFLSPHFELIDRCDLPFAIREHARKFQWSMAEATFWRRKVA